MLRAFVAALAFLFSTAAFAADPNAAATAAGISAAKEWLALVDKGDYAASWESSAAPMKAAVTPQQWDTSMKGVRAPLGTLVSRRVKAAKFTRTLPGAPDGQYVVITFRTRFSNKKAAIETVTPMLDADGAWHVSGYFIK